MSGVDILLLSFFSVLADYLLESIDDTVEPCEDFYQFSCGAWLENIRIPDDGNGSILPLTMLGHVSPLASAINTFRVLDKQLDDNMIGQNPGGFLFS